MKWYTGNMQKIKTLLKLLFWLIVCQLPGFLGASTVPANMDWYHTLITPPLTPPDMIFMPVWELLYLLLGVAAFLALQHKNKHTTRATALLLMQLVLNAAWTPIFFGLHHLLGAFILLLVMLTEGYFLHRAFKEQDPLAAWLLWPYWGWLCFATYLTAGHWLLN